ncbi:hypothetical protein GGTG_06817 [Gaeumannomyces tritici R3-111a-1]|uniref:Rhodopsin domain-containing protein n=1 Tax=Gaeumannomyces tritici (strain R3-111a-1) TaxID=644352 RepID=J3NZX0_GAET3|nr:hypothetical protein GGTG_06817 [Gaeumannomyces tritici R3-111a-1]EJT76903.1 hypothetical protein GGTG_06817 [Gaeumannomyces tritici R3-111a-1]
MSSNVTVIGAMPPPPGVVPNFDDPPSLASFIIAISVVLPAFSTCFVALRFYTTLRITHVREMSDNLRFGFGRHLWDVPFTTFNIHFFKLGAISGTFFGMSITFSKLSILAFYTRFAGTAGKHHKVAIYTLAIIVLIYGTVTSFQFLFDCQPIEKYWDFTITDGKCIDWIPLMVFNGVMNSLTDAAILILPIWLLWRLRLPLRQRMGVMGVMMTGGLILGVSIARAVKTVEGLSNPDFTWHTVPLLAAIACETHLGLVCVCLLSAKPFLRKHFPKVLGSSRGTHSATYVNRSRTTQSGARGYPLSSRDGDAIALGDVGQQSLSQTAIVERASTKATEEEQGSAVWEHGPLS